MPNPVYLVNKYCNVIIFTSYLKQKYASFESKNIPIGERNIVDMEDFNIDKAYPTIYFYDIGRNQIIW